MRTIRIITMAMLPFAMAAASLTAGAAGEEKPAAQISSQQQTEIRRVVGTGPRGRIDSPEDRARKYRSCLFTYLPRMGSDVAATLIRDACKAEYL